MRLALIAGTLCLAGGVAAAGPYDGYAGEAPVTYSSAGTDGWGVVPGIRTGPVKGTIAGTTSMANDRASWGHSTEFHIDALHTFGHDRRAYGISLGYLTQSNNGWLLASATPSNDHTFSRQGVAFTGILSTVISGRNSASARAGIVFGETGTMDGRITTNLWRVGGELTHVSTFMGAFDVASHLAVEYFTGSGSSGSYHALAIVYGATFAFGF